MAVQPVVVTLSDGMKLEALKRFRAKYDEEFKKLTTDVIEIRTELAEGEFLKAYLGEQPEVVELRKNTEKLAALEARRAHVGMLVERLDAIIPKQAAVQAPPPGGAPAGLRRY